MTIPDGPPGYPPYPGGPEGYDPASQPACVRHPDRPTGVRCARCERPSCPECLHEASVGFQCVDCVRQTARTTDPGRTVLGVPADTLPDKPLVVPALIVVNTAVFLFTVVQAASLMGNAAAPLFQKWSLYPRAVGADGEWWRLITSGFLHFGPLHLAFNMWALWVIGKDLELALGRARFLAIYFVSLLGGSAAVFVLAGERSDTAGASGAVFGLMGGLAVALLRLRQSPRPVLTLIAINIALSIAIPGISLYGHIGGMLTGAAATAVIVYAPRERQTLWQSGGVAGIVVLLLVIMAARATFVTAGAMSTLLG